LIYVFGFFESPCAVGVISTVLCDIYLDTVFLSAAAEAVRCQIELIVLLTS